LLLASLAGAIIGASAGLLRGNSYTASARFMPQTRSSPQSMSGLAAQLGMTLPSSDASQSPDFYVELARSREILERVASAPLVPGAAPGRAITIVDAYGGTGSERKRTAEAVKWLSKRINASSAPKTSLVSLSVRMPSAAIALAVTEEILNQIAAFNRDRRKSQASAERQFVEQQLSQSRDALLSAENMLQAFFQENRQYQSSPKLNFEQERLAREVAAKQEMVNTLTRSFEEARIEEVRNTPVLTVIEHPELPAMADSRHVILKTLLGAILSFTIMLVLKAISHYLARKREESPADSRELSNLSKQFFADIRHPLRLIGITKSGSAG
jgi:uncharacterized protein involved in exopolysaccharide biosynthesis